MISTPKKKGEACTHAVLFMDSGEFITIHELGRRFVIISSDDEVATMGGDEADAFGDDAALGMKVRILMDQGGKGLAPQGPKLGSQKHSQPPGGPHQNRGGLTLLQRCEEALVWVSRSEDFAPGGKGYTGWENFIRPLLDEVRKENIKTYVTGPMGVENAKL